jgi:hypothetical protein
VGSVEVSCKVILFWRRSWNATTLVIAVNVFGKSEVISLGPGVSRLCSVILIAVYGQIKQIEDGLSRLENQGCSPWPRFGTTDRTSSSLLRTVVAISGGDSSIISARLIMSSLSVPHADEIMAIIYYRR